MSNPVFTLAPNKALAFGKKHHKNLTTKLLLTLFIYSSASFAEDHKNARCAPNLIAQPQVIPAQTPNADLAKKYLEAERMIQESASKYKMQGQAVLKQPGLVVLSDELTFDQEQNSAVFNGNVEFHQPDVIITADKAEADSDRQKVRLQNTRYQLLPSRAHGQSKTIRINGEQKTTRLDDANLTTCIINADESLDWNLKFDDVEINEKTRRVIGKNTTLYFHGVPVFYTPYFDYPLDERASGLLFPEFGSYKSITEDNRNQFIKVPYYFNIAANMDDTLTVIPISERGLALDNEFRYIEKTGDILHSAEITLTALHDRISGDKGLTDIDSNDNIVYGDKEANRWRAKIKANQYWGDGLSSSINWQQVSDPSFFKEIPVERQIKNASLQNRYIRMDYQRDKLQVFAQLQSYMRLLNAEDNYEKRPEIGLSYYDNYQAFDFDFTANLTDFYVPSSSHSLAEGTRLHIAPIITHRLQNSYGYLNSSVIANLTQYQMEDNGFNPSSKNNLSRSVPQLAIRGGLIWERPLQFAEQNLTQTLEPEIQYLYTPFVDQSDFALFDSANRSLDFSNLFAFNRFTGSDRIGDTSQVSMALTTRFLSENGTPIAEAGIGQIAYLKDRKVSLSSSEKETESLSDLFIKLGMTLDQWHLSSNTQYDRDDLKLTNANTRLKWQNPTHKVLLNHTLYDNDNTDKVDMLSAGLYSKIHSDWELGLYSSYNLDTDKLYETQLGLRYDSCCWSAEIVAERTQLENGLYNDGIQIQFELKGLSTSGSNFKKSLNEKLDF